LKHIDATVATYRKRQMKYLKQTSETVVKTSEKHSKIIANICNIQINTLVNIHLKILGTYA
jgi:hypothetical protein